MRDNILFAVLGLGAGALVASIALGVVLVYRGSGIINVAMGAIAMVAAYIFWALRTDYFGFTLSTVPAFALTLVCMAWSQQSRRWPIPYSQVHFQVGPRNRTCSATPGTFWRPSRSWRKRPDSKTGRSRYGAAGFGSIRASG